MNKIALVSGATAGIGNATAKLLAKNNFNLIITGRRKERLDELKNELEKEFNVEVCTLSFDIRNKEQVFNAIENLPSNFKQIDVLINNAGLASGLGTIQDGDIDDWEKMVDTNIKGLLYLTKAVSPIMIENRKGHIVNIGSIAGKEVYPNGNVYCATKAAVRTLSAGMRIDLVDYGIRVTDIQPAKVQTNFEATRFRGKDTTKQDTYESYTPLQAEDVADAIVYAASRPPHVQITELAVNPTDQASAVVFRT